MFNFNINFLKVIKENLLAHLHTPVRLNRIKAAIKPFKQIYTEFTALRAEYTYKCRFNGEMIYLETALNDRFDPINRAIYIENAFFDHNYRYARAELRPALIRYARWNNSTSFATGKFCWYQGDIWVANATALNKVPGVDPQWTAQPLRKATILRARINYSGEVSFHVMVPVALVFSNAEMRSLIDYYKLAGRGYLIKTY